jgi:hypothetical protein
MIELSGGLWIFCCSPLKNGIVTTVENIILKT